MNTQLLITGGLKWEKRKEKKRELVRKECNNYSKTESFFLAL